MSDLKQLVYVSQATRELYEADLARLLERIRPNNSAAGVTGMLLYDGGAFMQVIEGNEATLEKLYNVIIRDPRHKDVVVILEKAIARRQFPDWSMGFAEINDEMLSRVDGLNDFFSAKTCLKSVDAGRAIKILESFQRGSWR